MTPPQDLAARKCVPCEGGVTPLEPDEIRRLADQLDPSWDVVHQKRLENELRFANFADALAFANRVGAIAEREGHHPEILIGWGKARVSLWTHAIDGLSENDFILASKIERLVAAD
jgi:4a-hydroxytetrahydrobiopterin dehydratase